MWKLKPTGYTFARFPWTKLSNDPTRFIEPGSLPLEFRLKDPGDLSAKDIIDLWKHVNHRQQSGRALALRFTDEVHKITAKKGKQVHMQRPLKPDPTPLTSLNLSADLLAIQSDDDSAKGSQAGPAAVKSVIESVHDPVAHACDAKLLRTPPTGSQRPSECDPTPLTSLDLSADSLAIQLHADSAKGSQAGPADACDAELLQAPIVLVPMELDNETEMDISSDCRLGDDESPLVNAPNLVKFVDTHPAAMSVQLYSF